jgi:hypothetical protein
MNATTVSPANLIKNSKEFYKRYSQKAFCEFSEVIKDKIHNFNLINKTISVPTNAREYGMSWKEWVEYRQPDLQELIAWRLWDGDKEDLTMDFWEIEITAVPRMSNPPGWAIFDFTVTKEYLVTTGNGENGSILVKIS